jgi:LuxR family maltose regulon positive regulatory protein
VPALPAVYVRRDRLLEQLDAAVEQPITLLCAPTGWGKTTLVASWIREGRAPGPVAYARFARDGVPAAWRLMHAFIAARLAVNTVTAAWVGTQPDERPVVVLDDLHNVTDRAALVHLERLVNRLSDRISFILLARTEPPLSLYRWRVRGELLELRTDHLSFRVAETAELLDEHGLRLSRRSLSTLWHVTEGWPAALCLVAAAMHQRVEPERVVAQLVRGESRLSEEIGLAEYLRREVLAPLSPDVRNTMLATSILDTVCPGLVEALTGHAQGARLLAQVGRANSLATFHGGAHSWYQYRRLLRSLMRTELANASPDDVARLHRAAATWYAGNGFPGDAVAHALSGGDWSTAEQLFGQYWPEVTGASTRMLATGELPRPPDDIAERPVLALALAMVARDTGNPSAMTAFIRLAERAFGDNVPAPFVEMLAGARLAETLSNGDFERAAGAAVRLLARTDEAPHDRLGAETSDTARSFAFISLAGTRLATRDLDTAEIALQQGFELARDAGANVLFLVAQRQQAYLQLLRGRLCAAASNARNVIEGARDAGVVASRNVSFARLVLAGVNLERGQVDAAGYHLKQALATSMPDDPVIWTSSVLPLARMYFARGEYSTAVEVMAMVRSVDGTPGQQEPRLPPSVEAGMLLLDADIQVAMGDLDAARQTLTDPRLTEPWPDRATLARARLELAEGRPSAAARLARQVAQTPVDSLVTAVDAAVLLAEALHQLGDLDGATGQIDRALRIAVLEGIWRPFVGRDSWISDLVSRRTEELAATIPLPHAPVEPAPAPAPAAPEPAEVELPTPESAPSGLITVPLTERETLVLQYLRSVLSIAEIANMLSVSANTIKTHVRHVYRKLGVSRRRDAVRRARELRLL